MKNLRTSISDVLTFGFTSKTAYIILCEIVIGIFFIILSLLFFANITNEVLLEETITTFDIQLSQLIYTFRTPLLNEIMIFISYFGADFILVFSTVIAIVLSWKRYKKESILFSIMLIFGAILNITLKQIFQRPRPDFDPLLTLTSYSFPSGHAMNSFVFYATLVYFTYHFSRSIKRTLIMTGIAAVLVLLIGMSRVYLGVHYPTDVLSGYIAGFLWFALVLVVERTLTFHRLYRKYNSGKRRK